jgi:hypothetical protein
VASLGFVFVVAIIVVPIPATASVALLGFVFVAASVALYTVFEVGNSFLSMLASDVPDRMLVAPVTGVAIECVGMARHAVAGGVVAVEAEVLLVLEGGRCPSFEAMAAPAVVSNLAMQNVFWSAYVMACATCREDIVSDECVSEDDTLSGPICAEVIAVTSNTCRLDQRLVKRWSPLGGLDGRARRRQKADHFEFVAGDALRDWRSAKWRMAGCAIVGDLFMALDHVAWADGDFGNPEDQCAVDSEKNDRLDEISHCAHPKTIAVAM